MSTRQPDIVLFMTDQQRADQVGFASDGFYETPALDALAARGVVFDTAYSASTTCVPARNALLTGIQQHRIKGRRWPLALPEGFWTVAHAVRTAGYETALIGKMHFTPMHAAHGFEVMRTCEHLVGSRHVLGSDGRPDLDDYHQWLVDQGVAEWERLEIGEPPSIRPTTPRVGSTAPFPYDIRYHPTTWIEENATSYLSERRTDRPLFLIVSFPHPHAPLNPLGQYATRYSADDMVLPASGAKLNDGLPEAFRIALNRGTDTFPAWRVQEHGEAKLRARLTQVRALVRHIDDAMGRLLDGIDLDRTLVAFTSDHGDYGGHRGLASKVPPIPFDDLVRVPLVLAGAGIPRGGTVSSIVQSSDLSLTFCAAAGIPVPTEEFDALSLLSVLTGEERGFERAAIFATNMGWPGVRLGAHKLIVHPLTWSTVVFDLEHDPAESVNLADDPAYRAQRDALGDLLRASFNRTAPDLERFDGAPSFGAPFGGR